MWTLIKLGLILAAVGAVIGGALHLWSEYVTGPAFREGEAKGQAEQKAADGPVLEKAKADALEAQGTAERARADTAACVTTSEKQSREVDKWKGIAAANAQAGAAERAKAAKEREANKPYVAELEERAAAKPKLMACEKERDLAKCIIANQIRKQRGQALVECKQ